MNSWFLFYMCLFLLIFCGFFSALRENLLVAGESNMVVRSNLVTKSLRTTIDLTSKFCSSYKPLTFYLPIDETNLVNRTKNSIKVINLNDVTVSTMTGGVLRNKVYQFHSYSLSWQACGCSGCSGVYNFKSESVFFNTAYGSYEEALCHPEGIAVVTVPISTSGNYSNPRFDSYSNLLRCEIKGPGSHAKIKSSYTYQWFANFPHGGIYHTCERLYCDQDTGKTTKALVIILPTDPALNFISSDQFKIFLKMADSMGESSGTGSCPSEFETHKGIVIYNLP